MSQEAPGTLHTFRDPAGSVEILPDVVYRSVRHPFASDFEEFLASSVARELVSTGKLVASSVVSSDPTELRVQHPRVPFISYPWEWPLPMWLEAADLTLDLCVQLLEYDWLLKDATPLNILFQRTGPVLVDVLSIEKAKPGESIWQAYGQFVRTFLLPLLAHSQLGWPLQAFQLRRDGFEPEEIFRALGWSQRLRNPARSAVTLPVVLSKLQSTDLRANGKDKPASRVMDAEIAKSVLKRRLKGLRRSIHKSVPATHGSQWKQYAETATHYSSDEHASKRQFVEHALRHIQPHSVLDIGCNSGAYSMIAAEAGARVVSIDSDMQALERLCTEARRAGKDILPLCVDIAYPTPALGWENRETFSFLSRCEQSFDVVLMLAVIHHLLLSSQIPLAHIASLVNRISRKALILEWVPPTDVKFVEVLRGRGVIYRHITEEAMRQAFEKHFSVVSETKLANGRILFHMEKRCS